MAKSFPLSADDTAVPAGTEIGKGITFNAIRRDLRGVASPGTPREWCTRVLKFLF
jgi:hypothetical protein